MIRRLIAGLLLVSVNTVADTQVTHIFQDGTPANASEVNKNFDDLEAAIDSIPAGATGPAGPTGLWPAGPAGPTGPAGTGGTAVGDIALTSTAGIIDIDAADDKAVDIRGGQFVVKAIGSAVPAISLISNGGTAETIVVTNNQGDTDASIAISSTSGGVTLSANSVLKLNPGTGGLITNRAVQTIVDSATGVTPAQYVFGFINVTGGDADTFILPKGIVLADAMPSDTVTIGDSFICYVINGSGGDITYEAGPTGSTLSAVGGSTLVQKDGSMAKLEFIFTVATGGSEEYYVLLHADNP
jgi:hypothetical protein